jgi:hypothetical protein
LSSLLAQSAQRVQYAYQHAMASQNIDIRASPFELVRLQKLLAPIDVCAKALYVEYAASTSGKTDMAPEQRDAKLLALVPALLDEVGRTIEWICLRGRLADVMHDTRKRLPYCHLLVTMLDALLDCSFAATQLLGEDVIKQTPWYWLDFPRESPRERVKAIVSNTARPAVLPAQLTGTASPDWPTVKAVDMPPAQRRCVGRFPRVLSRC